MQLVQFVLFLKPFLNNLVLRILFYKVRIFRRVFGRRTKKAQVFEGALFAPQSADVCNLFASPLRFAFDLRPKRFVVARLRGEDFFEFAQRRLEGGIVHAVGAARDAECALERFAALHERSGRQIGKRKGDGDEMNVDDVDFDSLLVERLFHARGELPQAVFLTGVAHRQNELSPLQTTVFRVAEVDGDAPGLQKRTNHGRRLARARIFLKKGEAAVVVAVSRQKPRERHRFLVSVLGFGHDSRSTR